MERFSGRDEGAIRSCTRCVCRRRLNVAGLACWISEAPVNKTPRFCQALLMLKRIGKNACTDFDRRTLPDDIAHVVLLRRSDDAKVVHGDAVSAYGDQ
jgi:hypothetical protein